MEFVGPDLLLVTSNTVKAASPLDLLHLLHPLKRKEEMGENYAFCQSSPLLLSSSGTVAKHTIMAMTCRRQSFKSRYSHSGQPNI